MNIRLSRFLAVLLASAALAGCAPAPEVTRANLSVQAPRTATLSSFQRKFEAQTRNVVYFAFNRDTLDAEARARLNEQAAWILKNDTLRFRVYGHTDKVGANRYNYDLGLRRANRVVDYLVTRGVARDRLEAMVSNGEDSPAIRTEDRERLNRRVVTEVFGIYKPKAADRSADGGKTRTPTAGSSATPTTASSAPQPTTTVSSDSGKNPNSGRGNGDEAGDPGKSGGKNNGGDEV